MTHFRVTQSHPYGSYRGLTEHAYVEASALKIKAERLSAILEHGKVKIYTQV
ncbi:MAG TPA: hypothetical protein VK716_10300 [Terracidiphilus sp.]|nr:hypothetical protein [Terracidiphilus sp.]